MTINVNIKLWAVIAYYYDGINIEGYCFKDSDLINDEGGKESEDINTGTVFNEEMKQLFQCTVTNKIVSNGLNSMFIINSVILTFRAYL